MHWRHDLMSPIKKLVSSTVNRSNYLLIPKWRVNLWQHATLLAALFARFNVDCVIDVGANRGQFRNFLRQEIGFRGLILSFEPIHHLAEACKTAAQKDPAWRVFEIALGNKCEKAPINVAKSDDLSSFLLPQASSPFFNESTIIRTELVQIKTLHSLLPELQSAYQFQSIFLKLDTQGFDLSVLEGSKNVLSSIFAVQSELSLVPIYEGMPAWTGVMTALKELRFEIAGLFPINRDTSGRVVEFDGVFVRIPFTEG